MIFAIEPSAERGSSAPSPRSRIPSRSKSWRRQSRTSSASTGSTAQIARDQIENLVRACDVHGVPAMVRVPGHAPEEIAAALDSGARGILVPRVSTAAQAAAVVKASRYPPEGERGVGPGRATGYGYRIFDYLAEANSSIVVAVQVETAEGLANVDKIAATDRRRCRLRRPGRSFRVARRLPAGRRGEAGKSHREDHRRPR